MAVNWDSWKRRLERQKQSRFDKRIDAAAKVTPNQIGLLVALGMARHDAEKFTRLEASKAIQDLKERHQYPNLRSKTKSPGDTPQPRGHAKPVKSQETSERKDSNSQSSDERRRQAVLKESETEWLLFIHASQRDRAKKLDGRRWDPSRRCWVYPKSTAILQAIQQEFGDDVVSDIDPSPAPSKAHLPSDKEATDDPPSEVTERQSYPEISASNAEDALLRETAKNYRLFVHPSQEHRARSIPHYRFDRHLNCWVFPKLRYIYDAILKEFRDTIRNEANAPEETRFEPPTRCREKEPSGDEPQPKVGRFCDQCDQRLHPLRLEAMPDATTCAICAQGSEGTSYKLMDASEQWFPRSESWISKANRRKRR